MGNYRHRPLRILCSDFVEGPGHAIEKGSALLPAWKLEGHVVPVPPASMDLRHHVLEGLTG
jgi:hypothetical protein